MSRTRLSDWTELVSIKCFTIHYQIIFAVVLFQSCSRVQLFSIPWTAALQVSLSFTISRSFLNSMSIESVMPSNHLTLCHHLLFLSSVFPSIRVFSDELALCIWWLKYWSFSFSISPSNEYSVLISFIIDWLDLLAIQGTLKSLPQPHNSKASVLRHSAFFMVQLSHVYVTTRKAIALTICIFVGKVMSLLFNTLSRFVVAFLPRSMCLLISPSTVIFGARENKICHCFHDSPFYLPWNDGSRCHDLSCLNVEF